VTKSFKAELDEKLRGERHEQKCNKNIEIMNVGEREEREIKTERSF
jgi:CO dehydrogenase/acetyl-CoA synthase alpha subunit